MPYVMDFDGNTASVVQNAYLALLSVYGDFDSVHVLVSLLVVRRIDKDFVEDLVQPRYEADLPCLHGVQFGVVDPHLLLATLHRANVGIRPLDNVFQLSELYSRISADTTDEERARISTFWY